MTAKQFCLLAAAVYLGVSADCGAATITFYDYDNFSWTPAPTLGTNAANAWQNYNWGQNSNATSAMGPTAGSATGSQPAAYSIWKVTAPDGQLLTSLTVHTRANFEKDTTGLGYSDLAYVQYALSSTGAWTKLYSHDFNKTAWTQDDQTGTIALPEPVAEIYIKIAATKYDTTYYWVGDYSSGGVVVGRQSNLRFTDLKVTGETIPVPEVSSLGLLGAAVLLAARKSQ